MPNRILLVIIRDRLTRWWSGLNLLLAWILRRKSGQIRLKKQKGLWLNDLLQSFWKWNAHFLWNLDFLFSCLVFECVWEHKDRLFSFFELNKLSRMLPFLEISKFKSYEVQDFHPVVIMNEFKAYPNFSLIEISQFYDYC